MDKRKVLRAYAEDLVLNVLVVVIELEAEWCEHHIGDGTCGEIARCHHLHLACAVGIDCPKGVGGVVVENLATTIQRPVRIHARPQIHFSATRERDDGDVGDAVHILHERQLGVVSIDRHGSGAVHHVRGEEGGRLRSGISRILCRIGRALPNFIAVPDVQDSLVTHRINSCKNRRGVHPIRSKLEPTQATITEQLKNILHSCGVLQDNEHDNTRIRIVTDIEAPDSRTRISGRHDSLNGNRRRVSVGGRIEDENTIGRPHRSGDAKGDLLARTAERHDVVDGDARDVAENGTRRVVREIHGEDVAVGIVHTQVHQLASRELRHRNSIDKIDASDIRVIHGHARAGRSKNFSEERGGDDVDAIRDASEAVRAARRGRSDHIARVERHGDASRGRSAHGTRDRVGGRRNDGGDEVDARDIAAAQRDIRARRIERVVRKRRSDRVAADRKAGETVSAGSGGHLGDVPGRQRDRHARRTRHRTRNRVGGRRRRRGRSRTAAAGHEHQGEDQSESSEELGRQGSHGNLLKKGE